MTQTNNDIKNLLKLGIIVQVDDLIRYIKMYAEIDVIEIKNKYPRSILVLHSGGVEGNVIYVDLTEFLLFGDFIGIAPLLNRIYSELNKKEDFYSAGRIFNLMEMVRIEQSHRKEVSNEIQQKPTRRD